LLSGSHCYAHLTLLHSDFMRFLHGLVTAFLLSTIHALPAEDGGLEKRDEYKDELVRCLKNAKPANESQWYRILSPWLTV
jgi:hypothetical protein